MEYNISKSKNSYARYKKLFDKAETEAKEVNPLISEYLEYTFPIYSGSRYEKENANKKYSIDLYDSTTLASASGMSQYIQSTLTPVWKEWAKIAPSMKISDLEEKLDKVYDKMNSIMFEFINTSNFSQESGVAMNNLVGSGTGALKIMEGTIDNPFIFTFVPLKNLSILEGSTGKVEKIFYKHEDMTLENISNTWGVDINKLTGREEDEVEEEFFDWEEEKTVIEGCVYLGEYFNEVKQIQEPVYHYFVCSDNFVEIYKEEYLTYNPFVIVRWSKRDDKTSWGHPIIADILPNVKTLNDAVKNELLGGERAVNPPIFLSNNMGDKGEFKIKNGYAYNLPLGANVNPVNFTPNYNLSLLKSQELKESIKEAFINVEKVFSTDRNTYKTAEEVARQHYEFTKRYSTTYGKIEKEYLSPILNACFEIMKKMGYIPQVESDDPKEMQSYYEMISKLKITYVNPLKKSEDREKVNSVLEFISTANQVLGQNATQLLVNPTVVIEMLKSKFDIDRSFVRNNEEIAQLMQQQAQIQQQLAESQQQPQEQQQQETQQQQGGEQIA